MAIIDFIYQGVQPVSHANKIKSLLALSNPELLIFNIAYLRKGGIDSIKSDIASLPNPNMLYCFIGIRNGITSIQGLNELLKLRVRIYVIDTGSTSIIFHPKIYLSKNVSSAEIIIGSANLTYSGLYKNIEASTHIILDMLNTSDSDFLDSIIDPIMNMPTDFPQNISEITNARELIDLLREGRIADERIPVVNLPSTLPNAPQNTPLIPTIPVNTPNIPPRTTGSSTPRSRPLIGASAIWNLLWESKPLSKRDLSIASASASKTNKTYSMALTKGAYLHINVQTYFYNTVFHGLTWGTKARFPTLLYSNATFYIQISGIMYGPYQLEIKHDPKTGTPTTNQVNAVTHLNWGTAMSLISNPALLTRILKLYRNTINPSEYLIAIN